MGVAWRRVGFVLLRLNHNGNTRNEAEKKGGPVFFAVVAEAVCLSVILVCAMLL